ncbi:glucose-1-phosphate thymidylyltransferase [Mucilaginibacter pallidiroseus]|uniref:Glucose-1-phosphate thymidylyltransferase n=1 Tax=Mucilaginibacter pallidiroseus TaxID=2599295 RepID=A0A563UJW1_9SPHI|nr:putative sugar nucleotidyl transferase [Mucilaginibacter pallidiroseus]TWR31667.1 glucose-1-phosphate thymidylyltransferase [Mucilaginibacter pallidiroseus]
MAIILFDDKASETLLPLTFTRPVADLRVGILTIAEKWGKYLNSEYSFFTQPYLQSKFPLKIQADNLFINGSVCPDEQLLEAIDKLGLGEAIKGGDKLLAVRLGEADAVGFDPLNDYDATYYSGGTVIITYPEHIFLNNAAEIRKDFALLTKGRSSATISGTNTTLGDNFFAEEGAEAECSIFNTKQGPIYLGKNSSVWENSAIRGPFALCENASVKMGTKIYPGTTIGPHSRVGGEINNAVIWGYSNKGHEGYLGNSVLGEWCNIGADSNNSNLKNNYADVKLWDYSAKALRNTGLHFCGLIMADHAKCSINTMFNTGTVVGVGANVFDGGFPPNFVPDFTWGGQKGMTEYRLDKMLETAGKVFARKAHRDFNGDEQNILTEAFNLTALYRKSFIK